METDRCYHSILLVAMVVSHPATAKKMSNPEHLELLRSGVEVWNLHRPLWPDLRGGDFSGLDLSGIFLDGAQLSDSTLRGTCLDRAQLRGVFLSGSDLRAASFRDSNLYYARLVEAKMSNADLSGANLTGATLDGAALDGAMLVGANLMAAHLRMTTLVGADLSNANLLAASLINADLTGAKLQRSTLSAAALVQTTIEGAVFDGAMVYGIAAWDLIGTPQSSDDLVISPKARVTVADLRVAQFIYLMLENREIRNLVDALTSKVVLILGRFSSERKTILAALRDELRNRDLVPVIFDFEQPTDRDITETVTLLARMARYVVADLTDPRSIPHELYAIAPHVEVPIQPIILGSQEPWSMFNDLLKFPWVLEPHPYVDLRDLVLHFDELLARVEIKRRDISERRRR